MVVWLSPVAFRTTRDLVWTEAPPRFDGEGFDGDNTEAALPFPFPRSRENWAGDVPPKFVDRWELDRGGGRAREQREGRADPTTQQGVHDGEEEVDGNSSDGGEAEPVPLTTWEEIRRRSGTA